MGVAQEFIDVPLTGESGESNDVRGVEKNEGHPIAANTSDGTTRHPNSDLPWNRPMDIEGGGALGILEQRGAKTGPQEGGAKNSNRGEGL